MSNKELYIELLKIARDLALFKAAVCFVLLLIAVLVYVVFFGGA